LHQIHSEDVFGPHSVSKVSRDKNALDSHHFRLWWNGMHSLQITSVSSRRGHSVTARGWYQWSACGLCSVKHL